MAKINPKDPVNVHICSRIYERRMELGIPQETLATAVGVSFQQIQKYETFQNVVNAARLYRIAKVLGVPVEWFFEGYR